MKPQAMLKYEEDPLSGFGYVVSRRQTQSLQDGLIWVEARSIGSENGLDYAKKVFEGHGYEIIDWDDDIEVLEG